MVYTKRQIQEAISYWKQILESNEHKLDFKPYEVAIIVDKDFLRSRKHEIFDLDKRSYSEIGGFKGASTPRTLIKDTDLAKIVFDTDGKIVALSLYRTDVGGNKRFCSATNKHDPRYKEAHKSIIVSDIEPYDGWYWTPVSGKNEHYFKKLGGNPIPNHIAVEMQNLSSDPSLELDPDGVHFSYLTKDDDPTRLTKMVFGFPSKVIYDKVMKSIEDYNSYKLSVNNSETHINEDLIALDKHHEAQCVFISRLFDLHNHENLNELTPKIKNDLDSSIVSLNLCLKRTRHDAAESKRIKSVLRRAYACRDEMEVLGPHQFKMSDWLVANFKKT